MVSVVKEKSFNIPCIFKFLAVPWQHVMTDCNQQNKNSLLSVVAEYHWLRYSCLSVLIHPTDAALLRVNTHTLLEFDNFSLDGSCKQF